MSFAGCFSFIPGKHSAYDQLSLHILNGKIHKGMTIDEVVFSVGKPSAKTNPTVYNSIKTQALIYRSGNGSDKKSYNLYFKNDKLIEWSLF